MRGVRRKLRPSSLLMLVISFVSLALLQLGSGLTPVAAGSVRVDGLVNSGSFALNRPIAPGTIATVFGAGFSGDTVIASQVPLPTSLGGASVLVNGIAAPLFFASPTQLNLQIPFELTGSSASLVVSTSTGSSVPLDFPLAPASPAIYTLLSNGSGPGAITHADGTLVTLQNPVQPGEVVVIYATGLGAVTPAVASGAVAQGPPRLSQLAAQSRVLFDGVDAGILFAGLTPGQVALYQINAQAPQSLKSKYPSITVQVNGTTSDAVTAGGPGILDIVPASAPANADVGVLLRGMNLPADAVLLLNGRTIAGQVTRGDLDQFQAIIPAAAISAAGQLKLQIASQSDLSTASNALQFTVNPSAPFQLSKTLLTFPQTQAACGGGSGYNETISIGNGGGGKFEFTTTSNAPWLSATPSRSTSPTSITISASPDGLPPGQYIGTVAVNSLNGGVGEVDVKVLLTVNNAATPSALIASPNVYVADSLQKIKLFDALPAGAPDFASIAGAGNEYQSFQIVINGGQTGLKNVSVDLTTPFTGSQCTAIPVTFYREHFLTITTPSHASGGGATAGVYPDPLVPFVNPFTGQPLRGGQYPAAPFDVTPGQNQPVYVEAYVPPGMPAGLYNALITVSRDGGSVLAQVPVTLAVWGFSLPAKPSLHTAFHAYDADHSIGPAPYYGYRTGSAEHLSMAVAMDEAMIAHRIMPESPINTNFQVNSRGNIVQDQVIAPKVDALLSRPEYSDFMLGLSATSPFADPLGADKGKALAYLGDLYQWMSSRGYLSKTWVRTNDEPQTQSDFQSAAALADLIHQANPAFRAATTTNFQNSFMTTLYGHIDTFVMNLSSYDAASVIARQAKGDHFWTYTALVQNSQNPSPYWQIEFPLLDYRIVPWINYRYGLEGLLYWTSDKWNEVKARGGSMWSDPCNLTDGGVCYNGDGNLFYPGKEVNLMVPQGAYGSYSPATVYGPVPSLRLKALRDGMQDFELLALAARRDPNAAMAVAIQVGCNGNANPGNATQNCFHNWNKDPAAIRSARAQLAAIIAGQ